MKIHNKIIFFLFFLLFFSFFILPFFFSLFVPSLSVQPPLSFPTLTICSALPIPKQLLGCIHRCRSSARTLLVFRCCSLPPPSCTKIWWSQTRCFYYSPSAAAQACAQVGPCRCAVAILSWHGGSVFFWHLSEGLILFVKHLSGKQDIYSDCRKGICWFTVELFS